MAAAASELKCTEVVVLDVRGLTAVCDWAIIASGTSDRQMRAVAQHLEDMGKERGMPPYRQSKDPRATWIVVDFVDTVVHIFEPQQRAFYDLEGLWSDAPRIRWRRTDPAREPSGDDAR